MERSSLLGKGAGSSEHPDGGKPSSHTILPLTLGYVLCSSGMMVVNKWALQEFPFPSCLMALQFFTSAVTVRGLGLCGQLDCDPLEASRVRAFLLVPLVFGVAIYSNIKLLQAASVETAIVFRTLVPILTSLLDFVYMGRELPSAQSSVGLVAVVLGAAAYALSSRDGIRVATRAWAVLYVGVLAFEMVYVKHVLSSVPMSTWTRVYYNNGLALFFMPAFILVGHEYAEVGRAAALLQGSSRAATAVGLSCLAGIGISFTGFGLRSLITATTFTVIGVMNKLLTVLLSLMLLRRDEPASPFAILALLACIAGGTLYRQAPIRAAATAATELAAVA